MQNYIEHLIKIIKNNYPKRQTDQEKSAFREYIIHELTELGWPTEVQDGNIITTCKSPKIILTAHYDTGNRITFISTIYKILGQSPSTLPVIMGLLFLFFIFGFIIGGITYYISFSLLLIFLPVVIYSLYPNPINMNDNTSGIIALFGFARTINPFENIQLVFLDGEEKHLKGSKAFSQRLKQSLPGYREIPILNFDCVGVGNTLIVSTLRNDSSNTIGREICKELLSSHGPFTILLKKEYSNSDYRSFVESPAVGLSITKKAKLSGYYMPNIHTPKDVVLNTSGLSWLIEHITIYLKKKISMM